MDDFHVSFGAVSTIGYHFDEHRHIPATSYLGSRGEIGDLRNFVINAMVAATAGSTVWEYVRRVRTLLEIAHVWQQDLKLPCVKGSCCFVVA